MSTLADRLRRGQQRAFSASCSTLPSVDAATGSPSSLASAAVAALRMCGFVVLRSALSMPHVESLAAAYADLPELVTADLRDGRREQLLPFAAPFNDDALLHGELWTSVAAEYLGATALDLDAVTVVLAPEGSAAQELHRDVTVGPTAVLSVHIPLVSLPSGGGTLSLQPASHLTEGRDCDAGAPPAPFEVPISPGSMILCTPPTPVHGSPAVGAARTLGPAPPKHPPQRLRRTSSGAGGASLSLTAHGVDEHSAPPARTPRPHREPKPA